MKIRVLSSSPFSCHMHIIHAAIRKMMIFDLKAVVVHNETFETHSNVHLKLLLILHTELKQAFIEFTAEEPCLGSYYYLFSSSSSQPLPNIQYTYLLISILNLQNECKRSLHSSPLHYNWLFLFCLYVDISSNMNKSALVFGDWAVCGCS